MLWGNAPQGDFGATHVHVAVDSGGHIYLAGEAAGGSGAWGQSPSMCGGYFCTFRMGFDASGTALWSRFDTNGTPASLAVDSAGRVGVVEYSFDSITVGTKTFTFSGDTSLVLLSSPIDGSMISAAVLSGLYPWTGTADTRGNSVVLGQYSSRALTIGATTLDSPGPAPANEALAVATVDGRSEPLQGQKLGDSGNTQSYAIAAASSGRLVVAATAEKSFATTLGIIQPGTFLAVYGPGPCSLGVGPEGASTGNPNDHGDLPPAGTVHLPPSVQPADCPASTDLATNGAACPVAMGCGYDSTCCFCKPSACNGQATTWTCNPINDTDANCPTSPPAAGDTCVLGTKCNYCLSAGRYYASCTAGGWNVGYAQLLCN